MATLVVVTHGVGNHPADFALAWEKILHAHHPDADFQVAGLWWEDLLEKVAEKFPIVEQEFADAVKSFGFGQLAQLLDSSTYDQVRDFFMDVLVYLAMGEMTDYLQTALALRLKQLLHDQGAAAGETVLIGHSLGAVALPHVVWRERNAIGYIPYRGLILLAPPLGMASPLPAVVKDPLAAMPGVHGMNRPQILTAFAREWAAGALHLLINRHDLICADVRFSTGGAAVDPIPVAQGFSNAELVLLERECGGSVSCFTQGAADPRQVAANHAVTLYLQRPEFDAAFAHLLGVAP
ncbi:MAG: hypothetical protein COW73_06680 [Nitrospirae bacterium CG18_big_fil_WC_8_21_14_2_50_70_55]|nr:hypothetical protein [Deltaproteobacteria bacterium]OIP67909.1 MAG: hypothetical protein AUK30_00130 [Nitrospirae bacterium CG2_30_70_394]PIQ04982.1 MAG: hypothetical protein COW73_06680 [Nitrospirae bacterium CG18_big_fil_WC_8_21_14_2_50_70_55]PIU77916.1 MAG: hypothetical protein COS73_08600 [Nitrospirae bacterium CG06_land_8_20_14_3_00_70_43]PIW83949.1 MAG: hypothetical protein COZ96_00620 [Nitrospirae bacterium CG_4_8_14_3_um_filter_70_85]HBB40152.1 hypothetical protein [Pseudomonadota b